MAKKKNPVSEYLASIGRKGGQAKVPKGISTLSAEERRRRASEAANKRWAAVKKAAQEKGSK